MMERCVLCVLVGVLIGFYGTYTFDSRRVERAVNESNAVKTLYKNEAQQQIYLMSNQMNNALNDQAHIYQQRLQNIVEEYNAKLHQCVVFSRSASWFKK